jgi:hypothetical protein
MCTFTGGDINVVPAGGARFVMQQPIGKFSDAGFQASPRRQRVFAALADMIPQAVSSQAVGKMAPHAIGIFKQMNWKGTGNDTSCTSMNPQVMAAATGQAESGTWAFHAKQNPGWVDYKKGRMPSIGDTYWMGTSYGGVEHVGIFVDLDYTSGGIWLCGDAGQKDRYAQQQAMFLVARKWECSGATAKPRPETPYLHHDVLDNAGKRGGETFPLLGWVDVDHPSVKFADLTVDAAKVKVLTDMITTALGNVQTA